MHGCQRALAALGAVVTGLVVVPAAAALCPQNPPPPVHEATHTSLTASATQLTFEQSLQVTAVTQGGGAVGSLTLRVDGQAVASTGGATLTRALTLTAGTHQVAASYSGGTIENRVCDYTSAIVDGSASPPVTITVQKLHLETRVTPSVAARDRLSDAAEAVTLAADVATTRDGAAVPGGQVGFSVDGGATQLAAVAGGHAEVAATLAPGTHTVAMHFADVGPADPNEAFDPSDATAQYTVEKLRHGTATVLSVRRQALDSDVIAVSARASESTGTALQGGEVIFSVDGVPRPATLVHAGQATLALGRLAPGTHVIGAAYADNGFDPVRGFLPSETTATLAVHRLSLAAGRTDATAGEPGVVVATFTDADRDAVPGDFTATVDWGDGTARPATIAVAGDGFAVLADAPAEGVYRAVRVTVGVGDDAVATSGPPVSIASAPVDGSALPVIAIEHVPFDGQIAALTDGDPTATAADLTASIDWGDGATSPGTLTRLAAGRFAVSGEHTYGAAGTYAVTVAASDRGGPAATIHGSAQVGALPPPTTRVALDPPVPNGLAGWYRTMPRASVSAVPGGLPVAAVRCALDPGGTPVGFFTLPGACPFAVAGGAPVAGDGIHTLYAAGADQIGTTGAPVAATIRIDTTPPVVTCAARMPVFQLGSEGDVVTATVGDAASGPASAAVGAQADLRTVGRHTATLVGADVAGNTTRLGCPYAVRGHFHAELTYTSHPAGDATTLSALTVEDSTNRRHALPAGAVLTVTCKGAGCPYRSRIEPRRCMPTKRHRCTAAREPVPRRIDLAAAFRRHRLGAGTRITVRMSAPGYAMKVETLTIRAGKPPRKRIVSV